MPENKHLRFLLRLLYVVLFCAGVYILVKYLLGLFLPFIIGLAVSLALEPLVRLLHKKLKIPRKAASAICTFSAYALLAFLIYLLSYRAVTQVEGFLGSIPQKLEEFKTQLDLMTDSLPAEISRMVDSFWEQMLSKFSLSASGQSDLVNRIAGYATSLPTIIISIIATLVSTYFISSDSTNIKLFISDQMSNRTYTSAYKTRQYLISTMVKWLKAQLFLIIITFAELTAGLLIIRVEYAVILAALIALVDALPILGVGTVLIPWALISLIFGDPMRALSLIILYLIITVVRNAIEPKIVGSQIGLNPLVMLMSLYIGFRLFGVIGMFLIPLILITLIQFKKWGYLDFFFEDEFD